MLCRLLNSSDELIEFKNKFEELSRGSQLPLSYLESSQVYGGERNGQLVCGFVVHQGSDFRVLCWIPDQEVITSLEKAKINGLRLSELTCLWADPNSLGTFSRTLLSIRGTIQAGSGDVDYIIASSRCQRLVADQVTVFRRFLYVGRGSVAINYDPCWAYYTKNRYLVIKTAIGFVIVSFRKLRKIVGKSSIRMRLWNYIAKG